MLISSIKDNDSRAELIEHTVVIGWDEAPMANRAVFSCVEDISRRVMGNDELFGGKIVILLGDFRQTCPVIRRGTRIQVVDASLKSSPLWPSFNIMRLTEPIRNAEDPLNGLRIVYTAQDLIDFVYPSDILLHPHHCLQRAILAPTNAQVDMYNDAI